jgi:hypothetical protein
MQENHMMSNACTSGGLDVIDRPAFSEALVNLNVAPQPNGAMRRWLQRQPSNPLLYHGSRLPPFLSASEQYYKVDQPASQTGLNIWPHNRWR